LYVGVEEIFASLEQFEKAVYPQSSIYETLEYRSFWDPELFRIYFESVELKLANQLEASLSLEHGTQGSSKFRCLATEGLEMFLKKSWSSEVNNKVFQISFEANEIVDLDISNHWIPIGVVFVRYFKI